MCVTLLRMYRGVWLRALVAIAVAGVLFTALPAAAADPSGLLVSTDSVTLDSSHKVDVSVVNSSALAQPVTLLADHTLRDLLIITPDCGASCPTLKPGQLRSYQLSEAKPPASPVTGRLFVLGLGAQNAASVTVTAQPAVTEVAAAGAPSLTVATHNDWLCKQVTLLAGPGFVGAQGQLGGPHASAQFAVVPVTDAAHETHGCAGHRAASALIASPQQGNDPAGQYLLVADRLSAAGSWTGSVKLDPDGPGDGGVTVSIDRSRPPWVAALWILVGSALASGLGYYASRVQRAKDTSALDTVIASAADTQSRILADLTSHAALFNPDSKVQQAWTVVGDDQAINRKLSVADAQAKATGYAAAVAAVHGMLADIDAHLAGKQGCSLLNTLIATIDSGPDLDSSGTLLATCKAAQAWFAVLRITDSPAAGTLSQPDQEALHKIQRTVLEVNSTKLVNIAAANDQHAKALALTKVPVPAPLRMTVANLSFGGTTIEGSGYGMTGTTFGGSAYISAAAGAPPVVVTSAPITPAQRAARSERVLFWFEVVAALLALVAAEAVALGSQYYSKQTWGSLGDVLSAVTWAVATAGTVQVSKLFVLSRPPITVAS